jgi:hypothetical protein
VGTTSTVLGFGLGYVLLVGAQRLIGTSREYVCSRHGEVCAGESSKQTVVAVMTQQDVAVV